MTKDDIIDIMLSVVGESGVSSTLTTHPSVQTALHIFNTENVAFQGRGWWFNTEYQLTLVSESDGKVVVPKDTLDLRLSGVENLSSLQKVRYVRRGGFLYDAIDHTYIINDSIDVDLVMQLDVQDMPSVAAVYLMRKCAEEMYIDDDGDTFKSEKLESKRREAWQALKATELKTLAVNAQDSPAVQAMMSRLGQGFSTGNPNLIGGRIR